MIPTEGTMHFVNGKQLCEQQYADYREASGYAKGKQAGRREVVEWIRENFIEVTGRLVKPYRFINEDDLQAKLKEWE